jgi:hypothetical protein
VEVQAEVDEDGRVASEAEKDRPWKPIERSVEARPLKPIERSVEARRAAVEGRPSDLMTPSESIEGVADGVRPAEAA